MHAVSFCQASSKYQLQLNSVTAQHTADMLGDLFAVDKFVIISSKDEIDMSQWRRYLVTNWERLMPARTRLLVLAGIHGCKDGARGAGRMGLSRTLEDK